MGLTFLHYKAKACCLCGSADNLTGEHKIKASALRLQFDSDHMVIGRPNDSVSRMRPAQSAKSKAFHFAAPLCRECNGNRTQPSDLEFDRFHTAVNELLLTGADPALIFSDPRYEVKSEPYLNVFRYFAKLLCCHMAESGAPRPKHMASFARGLSLANCVWLGIDHDWTYRQMFEVIGHHKYAAHGGLVVYGNKKTGSPTAFQSTLTIGQVRYVFFSRLNWIERLELKLRHKSFNDWCRDRVQEAIEQPMSEAERLALGLDVE